MSDHSQEPSQDSPQTPPPTAKPPTNQPAKRTVSVSFPLVKPIATYVLLVILVGIAVIQIVLIQQNGKEPLTDWGYLNYKLVLNGQFYRLFTAMFLHADESHIFFNALSLYFIGRNIEAMFGRERFLIIYFLGGLCGSVASFILGKENSLGASGAIFALIGAEMVFLWHNRRIFGQQARQRVNYLVILVVLSVVISIASQNTPGAIPISLWGHVGGLFGGVVLTWFIGPQYVLEADKQIIGNYKIKDTNNLVKYWQAPLLFSAGIIAAFLFAVVSWR